MKKLSFESACVFLIVMHFVVAILWCKVYIFQTKSYLLILNIFIVAPN